MLDIQHFACEDASNEQKWTTTRLKYLIERHFEDENCNCYWQDKEHLLKVHNSNWSSPRRHMHQRKYVTIDLTSYTTCTSFTFTWINGCWCLLIQANWIYVPEPRQQKKKKEKEKEKPSEKLYNLMMFCTNWKVLDYSDYVVSIEIEMRNALFKQK